MLIQLNNTLFLINYILSSLRSSTSLLVYFQCNCSFLDFKNYCTKKNGDSHFGVWGNFPFNIFDLLNYGKLNLWTGSINFYIFETIKINFCTKFKLFKENVA